MIKLDSNVAIYSLFEGLLKIFVTACIKFVKGLMAK